LTGIGINLNQLEFPEEINKKAVSIRQALAELQSSTVPVFKTHDLLETILPHLQKSLSPSMNDEWNAALQKKLYRRGESISFVPGQADSKEKIEGILEGIGPGGELLIKTGTEIKSFITGELEYQLS
jgi:BirA family biotin operon repressor/biotin-[acetyl-CoA-carboxylase] ligase